MTCRVILQQQSAALCESLHGTHHESDGPLLIDVNGNVGALDPGVGTEMPQPNVRVSGRQTMLFSDNLWQPCVTNTIRAFK